MSGKFFVLWAILGRYKAPGKTHGKFIVFPKKAMYGFCIIITGSGSMEMIQTRDRKDTWSLWMCGSTPN